MANNTPTRLQAFLADPDVAGFDDAEPMTIKVSHVDDFTMDISDLREVQNSHDALLAALTELVGGLSGTEWDDGSLDNARAVLQEAGR